MVSVSVCKPARKRPLPYLPKLIGVVTSPTGAVIKDILHRLSERFPRQVLLWPVAVQGEGAAEQIAAAIAGFNALPGTSGIEKPDLLIVARGGGSVEDLMPFNEECVVRAVANSKIPVISAVGHETDTTLIDYASDLRAPTPTAAAEKAVPVRADLLTQIEENGSRLFQAAIRLTQDRRERLRLIERALGDPARAIEPLAQRLDEKSERLSLAWRSFHDRSCARMDQACGKLRHPRDILALATQRVNEKAQRLVTAWRSLHERNLARVNQSSGRLRHPRDLLSLASQRLANADQRIHFGWTALIARKQSLFEQKGSVLEHLSPRAVLGRGYALVQDAKGQVIASSKQVRPGDKLNIGFHDGEIKATAE